MEPVNPAINVMLLESPQLSSQYLLHVYHRSVACNSKEGALCEDRHCFREP